jgi:hypothetical protein
LDLENLVEDEESELRPRSASAKVEDDEEDDEDPEEGRGETPAESPETLAMRRPGPGKKNLEHRLATLEHWVRRGPPDEPKNG